jgi:hypothetical protein
MANDVHMACEEEVPNTADEDFRSSGGDGRVRPGKTLDHAVLWSLRD